MRQIKNKATIYRIIQERSGKCVIERHKRGLQRNNESYKFKLNRRLFNMVALGFYNTSESLCSWSPENRSVAPRGAEGPD